MRTYLVLVSSLFSHRRDSVTVTVGLQVFLESYVSLDVIENTRNYPNRRERKREPVNENEEQ
jgi:hypothetical protein